MIRPIILRRLKYYIIRFMFNMNISDFINGGYEFFGSIAVWVNVIAIYKDKKYAGVRIAPFVFFTSWSVWNLYYYPHLNQWISLIGGFSIMLANVAYLTMMIKYRGINKLQT